jgi:flavorubredoxin
MTTIDQIAPDTFRISTYAEDLDLQFNQFLVRDDEPLLYHTGMREIFPAVRQAVATLIDPADLRWIGFSHFEPDECGSLNEWLDIAPQAQPVSGIVGSMVFIGDFSSREPRTVENDEVFSTGSHSFRYRHTPHFPHGWDAGMLFDETTGVLFCSDLLHHMGNGPATTEEDMVPACREALEAFEQSPLANYMPYTKNTARYVAELAALNPTALATMHGSTILGDGAATLTEFGVVLKEVFGDA